MTMLRGTAITLMTLILLYINPSYQESLFLVKLTDKKVAIGDTSSFTALLVNPTQATSTWNKDGVQLDATEGRYKIEGSSDQITRSLIIHNSIPSDNGRYTLEILGEETSATLTVTGATIKDRLQDMVVTINSEVILTVVLSETVVNTSKVKWERDSTQLSNSTKYEITVNGASHSLKIKNVQPEYAGQFSFTLGIQVTSMYLTVTSTPDTDECSLHTDNCDDNAQCTNIVGSFRCTCKQGYSGDGVSCSDVDECSLHTDNCHANAHCTNTVGSFQCTCKQGYSGHSASCSDVDECALNITNCHTDAVCTNTPGAFTCVCRSGYTGNGRSCTEIKGCSAGATSCHADATCTNTDGSSSCVCNAGYTGDGFSCTKICTSTNGKCSTSSGWSQHHGVRLSLLLMYIFTAVFVSCTIHL